LELALFEVEEAEIEVEEKVLELALFEIEEAEIEVEEAGVEVWAEAVFWSVQQEWLVLRIAGLAAALPAALAGAELRLAAVKVLEPAA
jgi:hypothetical protein